MGGPHNIFGTTRPCTLISQYYHVSIRTIDAVMEYHLRLQGVRITNQQQLWAAEDRAADLLDGHALTVVAITSIHEACFRVVKAIKWQAEQGKKQ